MTMRQQIINLAARKYARHIQEYGWTGARKKPADLAWEIVEGLGSGADSYCSGISDASAERMCAAIVGKAKRSLRIDGLDHEVIVKGRLTPPW